MKEGYDMELILGTKKNILNGYNSKDITVDEEIDYLISEMKSEFINEEPMDEYDYDERDEIEHYLLNTVCAIATLKYSKYLLNKDMSTDEQKKNLKIWLGNN